jgi:hypothetical protein
MGDGQRSEDMIPFASKCQFAGKPAEAGAELATTIVADPVGRVKMRAEYFITLTQQKTLPRDACR